MIVVVPSPESLKARWSRLAVVVAILSTAALSAALLLVGRPPAHLLILWVGCFPAFWLALRIIGAIAWDTSFKATSRFKVAASPTQVFVAEIVCLVAMLAAHVMASWVWTLDGIGVVIFIAWLLYAAVAIAVSIAVYLPSLFVAKALIHTASLPNGP